VFDRKGFADFSKKLTLSILVVPIARWGSRLDKLGGLPGYIWIDLPQSVLDAQIIWKQIEPSPIHQLFASNSVPIGPLIFVGGGERSLWECPSLDNKQRYLLDIQLLGNSIKEIFLIRYKAPIASGVFIGADELRGVPGVLRVDRC